MTNKPNVASTTESGLPVYDIRTAPDGKSNPHAYWWGMNFRANDCEPDAIKRLLETHEPKLTQDEWDDLWTGFTYGHNITEENQE